jgi:hypothetical protein
MERMEKPALSRSADPVEFLLHHPDVRAELLSLIHQALAEELDMPTFWHRYNVLWTDVPAGVLTIEDEEFFGEVNERLHYTDIRAPADPALSDPAAFTSWLAEAVIAFEGGSLKRLRIQNARTRVVKIAAAVLVGQLSPVVGAIDLNALRSSVDVPDDDPDFEVFMLIDSECDGLPIGSVRQCWSPEALSRKEPEVARAERWAMDSGIEAFRNVLKRFGPAA